MPGVGAAVMSVVGGIGGAVAGTGAAISGVAAGVGSTAAGIASGVGSAVPAITGAVTGTAGKIAAGVVPAVTGLGKVIPAATGGISGVATALKPAAELFGAGVGILSSVKQVGLKEKELDVAAQQAENQKKALELQALQDPRLYRPDLKLGAPVEPYETAVRIFEPLDQAKIAPEQAQLQEQIMTYAPLILIGIVGIVLMRKIWK